MDWRETLRIGVKLAGALEAAHRAGILHRDVKPGNILLTDYGEPQLTDFGIARIAGGFQTATGVITGSPAFTAPEVLEGADSDARIGRVLAWRDAVLRDDRSRSVRAPQRRAGGRSVPPDHVTADTGSARAGTARRRGRGHRTGHGAGSLGSSGERGGVRRRAPRDSAQQRCGRRRDGASRRLGRGTPDVSAAPSTVRRDIGATPTPADAGDEVPPSGSDSDRWSPATGSSTLFRAGGRRRVVLIHAPSGFGKSTLAAQWREELVRDGVAVAWLTIDDDDNNVVWFLAHLLESIRRVRPALAASLGQVLEEHGDDAGRYVLTTLIDEIHEKDDRIALVIDDWHRVSDPATTAALGFLLEHGCHHLQIIVTSWSRAGLPVSRLRIQDELVEIDCESMRFDDSEARSFLNDVGGLQLSGSDVDALTASTDGWAAALQLAALSLRGGGDANSLIGRLSGASDVIGEFLAENVVDTLEPEMREFLLATSITERTCGGLASALAGVHARAGDARRRRAARAVPAAHG